MRSVAASRCVKSTVGGGGGASGGGGENGELGGGLGGLGGLGGTSLHAPSWSRRSSGWSCSSHSRSRKSRHGASAHSANLQSPNPSGSAADEPSQLCQHADGSQKPTSPETKPLMRHVDSICAISRQAARCVRPSVASLQMARVRGRTSLSTNMRSERAWMLGGGGGAGARQWPSALPGGGGGAVAAASQTSPSARRAAHGSSRANMCELAWPSSVSISTQRVLS